MQSCQESCHNIEKVIHGSLGYRCRFVYKFLYSTRTTECKTKPRYFIIATKHTRCVYEQWRIGTIKINLFWVERCGVCAYCCCPSFRNNTQIIWTISHNQRFIWVVIYKLPGNKDPYDIKTPTFFCSYINELKNRKSPPIKIYYINFALMRLKIL